MPRPARTTIGRIALGGLVLWLLSAGAARGLVVSETLPHSDAVLVLAGGAVYDERVRYAAAILRERTTAIVLLTNDGQRRRWSRLLQRNPTSVEEATVTLERQGISPDRIRVLPGIMRGTSDEAQAVRTYALTHGMQSVLAVTSPYHTRRTLWTLKHFLGGEGIDVGIEPVPDGPSTPRAMNWWASREGWRTVGAEFLKLPYYWVRFGLIESRAD